VKAETWLFGVNAVFFVIAAPAYWLIAEDPTGTAALTMTALLCLLVTFYLGFHASKMEPRPEDRKEGEIAEGAGELGFFPPHSWWPLALGASASVVVLGVIFGWWLAIIGAGLVSIAVAGWIFEYYVGEHAH
jgi:hypothetical protein